MQQNLYMEFKIITKKLNDTLSKEESTQFNDWYNQSDNHKLYFHRVKENYDKGVDLIDSEKAWRSIYKRISTKPRHFTYWRYAAATVLLLSFGYYFVQSNFINQFNPETLSVKEESIILELENGLVETISLNDLREVKDIKGNIIRTHAQNQLQYSQSKSRIANIDALVYNTLRVPFGKRFELTLSDGTEVFLNSGTSLKFPVAFLEGQERKVFLEGEAYFNVAHDAQHPFIVTTNEIGIRVLGTKFNLSAYKEDSNVTTVLESGRVGILTNGETYDPNTLFVLDSGYSALWDKESNQISVKKADVKQYTSWIDGKLIFRDEPFKNIRKILERQYNVTIINNNAKLDEQRFYATFEVGDIEKVLEVLNESFAIKYKIVNNQLIIN